MNPFDFARLPRIYFGSGKINKLPGIVSYYGMSVLLVTGATSFMKSPLADSLFRQMEEAGMKIYRASAQGEPSPGLVDETIRRFWDTDIDVVVSIGGGSVMDAGKAISAMLHKSGSVVEYLEVVGGKEHPGTKVPFIAVPTTSGTGSEATKNAVISEVGSDGFKRSLRHDNLVPDIALIDPELTLTCPPEITAAAGMDCFTQLTESYLSTKANVYTDALALEGIRAINRSLLRSYTQGDNLDARSDMSLAALTSGICLANAGLGAVHGLAGTIGAIYNAPHGAVCGTLMAVANEVSVRELRSITRVHPFLKKYAVLGRLFSGGKGKSDDYLIDSFIGYLHEITDSLELPRLAGYGIRSEDLAMISAKSDVKNNPVGLPAAILSEILARRL